MLIKVVYLFWRIAFCPQELLKVHGMHLVVFFISDGIALYLLVVDAHQRTGADDVVAPVFAKGFERSGAVGTFLQLVKKEQRLVRNEFPCRLQQRDVLDDVIRFIAVVEDAPELLLEHEVDFNDRFIVVSAKRSDGLRLTYLSRALYDERLVLGAVLPVEKELINLSFKQFHGRISHFRQQIYTKNHIFGLFSERKFTFSDNFLHMPKILAEIAESAETSSGVFQKNH